MGESPSRPSRYVRVVTRAEEVDDGDGETKGLLRAHHETYGAAGTSVDPTVVAAAAAGDSLTVNAVGSDGTSSDDGLVE